MFHFNGLLYYSLEYGPVNLQDLIMKEKDNIELKPEHVKCILKQILSGLEHMHANKVMHRDLKPDNMVIDETGTIKIIDFNSAKIHKEGKENTKATTTLTYRSPEQLFSSVNYGPSTDMWAVGVIFAELFTRVNLFKHEGQIQSLMQIFTLRGSRTEENWPDAENLPDYMEF